MDPRRRMTPSLSCLKESRGHSRFSTAHSKDPKITSAFKVPWTSEFFTSTVEREELSIHWLVLFPPHSEPMLQRCQYPLSSSSDQLPQIPGSSISLVSSTAATVAVDGARLTAWIFLSFALLPDVSWQSAHLWPFLPLWRHSPSNLAGLFLSVVVLFDFPMLWPLPLP